MQPALFHESIQDALREVIRAAGGAKIVGAKLWPSLPVDQAASKISDCLNPDRRQHFSEAELLQRGVDLLWQRAGVDQAVGRRTVARQHAVADEAIADAGHHGRHLLAEESAQGSMARRAGKELLRHRDAGGEASTTWR